MNLINFLAQSTTDINCTIGSSSIGIPEQLAHILSLVYHLILIGVPILLILFGMLDLGKAVMAQKEDEIKKGQQTFFKRLIAAAIVFFVFIIVKLLINLLAGDDGKGIIDCLDAILKS